MATVVVAMYNLAKRREKNRAVRPNLEERLLAEGKVNAIRKFQQMFRSRFVSVDRKLLLSRLEMEDQFCYEGCRLPGSRCSSCSCSATWSPATGRPSWGCTTFCGSIWL